MEEKKNRQRVMAALEEAVRAIGCLQKFCSSMISDWSPSHESARSLAGAHAQPTLHILQRFGLVEVAETICYDISRKSKRWRTCSMARKSRSA
jgi:hypothetical protein